MKQCKTCFRLLAAEASKCLYCGSLRLGEIKREEREKNGIFDNFKIRRRSIEIKGERFHIEELLGKGGYATVLKVRSNEGRQYALKVSLLFDMLYTNNQYISNELVESSVKYLEREIKRYSKLKSEKVMKIYDCGVLELDGEAGKKKKRFPYILSEMANTDLEELIKKEASGEIFIPAAEKKKKINGIIDSMIELKRYHIVHRDISLGNIFLVNRGERIRYTISDLGTSKDRLKVNEETRSACIVGKKGYIDPVRFQDKEYRLDERIDIYSLGITILEICLGNTWKKKLTSQADEVEEDIENNILMPYLSRYLEKGILRIIRKCVTVNMKRRYRKLEKVKKDLERYFRKRGQDLKFCGRKKTEKIKIRFEIELPFGEIENRQIEYDGINLLKIAGIKNSRVTFKNRVITRVKKKGSKLFKPAPENGTGEIKIEVREKLYKKIKEEMEKAGKIEGILKTEVRLEYESVFLKM